jgi:CHASE2 domain-containing sensor protein
MIQMATNYTLIISALIVSATLLFVSGFGWLTLLPLGIALFPGVALLRLWQKIQRQDRMM